MERPIQIQNKFYVGASHLADGRYHNSWLQPSILAAQRHAQSLMEQDGTEEKIIVKIVAVVRKRKPIPVPPPTDLIMVG